jgi:predicted nucleic acid-binding protein
VSLVLDASLAIAWHFEDERTRDTEAALERVIADGAVVPTLWRIEVASGFQAAMRRNRIDRRYRDEALQQLAALPIVVDSETVIHAWSTTLSLADEYGLTPYDATYLELAQRRLLPLASLDKALLAAARKARLPLLENNENPRG